jgi:hypothetical protein
LVRLLLLLTLPAYTYRGLTQFFDPLNEDVLLAKGCFVVFCPQPAEPSDQQSIQAETYPNDNRSYTRIRNPANDLDSDS